MKFGNCNATNSRIILIDFNMPQIHELKMLFRSQNNPEVSGWDDSFNGNPDTERRGIFFD